MPALRLPDLKPIVLGLSKCGNLEYEEGENVTLKCKARGKKILSEESGIMTSESVIVYYCLMINL